MAHGAFKEGDRVRRTDGLTFTVVATPIIGGKGQCYVLADSTGATWKYTEQDMQDEGMIIVRTQGDSSDAPRRFVKVGNTYFAAENIGAVMEHNHPTGQVWIEVQTRGGFTHRMDGENMRVFLEWLDAQTEVLTRSTQ